jgi:hypothetical protein
VAERIQNLSQQIREQTLKSAQDLYGNSLGDLIGQVQNDRSQLQELLEQLPESHEGANEDARKQLEQLVSSYDAIENSLKEFAQRQGVEEAMNQAGQSPQEIAGQAQEEAAMGQDTHQAPQAAGQDTEQAQGAPEEAAEHSQEDTGEPTEQAPGVVRRASKRVGEAVGRAARAAWNHIPGTHLLSESTDEAGQVVQRTVDESGDIVETTLDEAGNVVDEDIVGTVNELPSEEEYTNEEGRLVRTVKEETGALIHITLGPDGSILDLALPPQKEEVKEKEVLEEGHSKSHSRTS